MQIFKNLYNFYKKCTDVPETNVHGMKYVVKKPGQIIHAFTAMEAAGGILLVIAAIVAILLANTPFYDLYHLVLNEVKFRIGFSNIDETFDFEIHKSILLWINDGLMAIFFFLVGLEIKAEVLRGKLASFKSASLPAIAAIGGIAVPALLFWSINKDHPEFVHGWAIPAATDIAFALGVLSLLGKRVPASLKVLLTAIAIIDDIAAIIIIALFYSGDIATGPLCFAAGAIAILFILNRMNVCQTPLYIIVGIVLWVAVLESGIHATLAGVLVAMFIPMYDKNHFDHSPVRHLEHYLHAWVAFGVLPVFAFANAGIPLGGLSFEDIFNPLTIGIIAGLFIGKQLGIFTCIFLAVKTGISPKPAGANWVQIYAISILCGIGFTMSLFIGGLSFADVEMQAYIRLGVLIASALSAMTGYVLLRCYSKRPPVETEHTPEYMKL